MSIQSKEAKELFLEGYNCSQAVLATFSEKYGLPKIQAFSIACGFGGGVRAGEICGAVSGAVIVIGLKYGADKIACYEKTVEFNNAFKQKNGYIVCRDLLGYDISTEVGMNTAKEKGLFSTQSMCMQYLSTICSLACLFIADV